MHDTVIHVTTMSGVRVVKVENEVDIANAAILQRYLDEASTDTDTLVVSLANCRYMDSTGLRPIMRLAERIGDGFFIVVPPGTQIRRIFDLTRLGEHMHVTDTLSAALAAATTKATPA